VRHRSGDSCATNDGELALSLQDLTRLSSDGRKELEELLEGARKQGISVGLEALIQELQRKLQALRDNRNPTSLVRLIEGEDSEQHEQQRGRDRHRRECGRQLPPDLSRQLPGRQLLLIQPLSKVAR